MILLTITFPNITSYASGDKLSPTGIIYLLSMLSSKGYFVNSNDLDKFVTEFENTSKDVYIINENSNYFFYNLLFKNEQDSDQVFDYLGYGGYTGGGGSSRKFTSKIIVQDIKNLNTDEKMIFDYDKNIILSKKITNNNGVYYLDLYQNGKSIYPYPQPDEFEDVDLSSPGYKFDRDNIKVRLDYKHDMTYLYLTDSRNFFYLNDTEDFDLLNNKEIPYNEDGGYMRNMYHYQIPNIFIHIYQYKDCFISKSLEVPFYSYYNHYLFDSSYIDRVFNSKAGYITGIFDDKGSQNFDISRITKCIPFSNLVNVNEKKDFNYILNYPIYDYFSKYNQTDEMIENNLTMTIRSINKDFIKDFNDYLHGSINTDIDRGYYVLDKDIIKFNKVDNKKDDKDSDCCICNIDYSLIDKIVKDNLKSYYENNIKTIVNNIDDLKSDINYVKNNINKIDDIDNSINKINSKLDNLERFDNSNLLGVKEFNEFKIQYASDIKEINKKLDNNKIKDLTDEDKNNMLSNAKDSLDFFARLKKFFTNFFTITEKFDFKKIESEKLSKKIPFSIFTDLKNVIGRLLATPKVPVITFPIFKTTFTLDFNKFEKLAVIVRSFILLDFLIFLILFIIKKEG